MKKILFLVAIITLASCQPNSENSKPIKTMMIKTFGMMEVAPNMASFTIGLSCEGRTTTLAKDCLVEKSEDLNKTLRSYGIAQEDILTNSVNMRKDYAWSNGKRIFKGYIASTQTFVTVKNLDKLDELYTTLLENKNLNLNGLNYAHSQVDSLKNEAYLKAFKKAGVTADKILEGLPETQKEVLQIGNVSITSSKQNVKNIQNLRNEFVEEKGMDMTKPITISNGKIKVFATLHVEYSIY
jgi:uncharacterized protein YggE